MISFHNDVNIKNKLIKNLQNHYDRDEITQGNFWENGKGCAVGCSIVDFGGIPSKHSEYERLFGIPRVIAKLEDRIFEGLSPFESKLFPLEFSKAIPVGVDLSLVWPKLAVFILTDNEFGVKKRAKTEKSKALINKVSDLYKRVVVGELVNIEEFRTATADAAYAAGAAYGAYGAYGAYAAGAAYGAYAADAYAAADAAADAYSNFKIIADKLIEILKSS